MKLRPMVSPFRVSTRPNATSISTANKASAARPLIAPVASGRALVRSTCGSSQRSA
jgi:hypothetical protein